MKLQKKMTRRILAIAFALFVALGNVARPFSNIIKVNAAGASIYVDGVNGNDSNDGKSASSAVKSWQAAKDKLGCEEGEIIIVGTVEAEGFITTKEPSKQVVKRASDIVMFNVASNATFANIVVNGENKEYNSPAVKPSEGATVNFLTGAEFYGIGYEEGASANGELTEWRGIPDNEIGGLVCSVVKGVNILVDGASFHDNNGKGIFFAPLKGFDAGPRNVTLIMKSGSVTGNKGFFYHNEASFKDNKIIILNALITGNNAANMDSRYKSYTNRNGAVYVCDMGQILLYGSEGAAIYGNTAHDIIYINGEKISGTPNVEFLTNSMLGGGNPNYQHSTVDDSRDVPGEGLVEKHYDVYDASPSDGDKSAAESAATSKITGNSSIVINSNGYVIFGSEGESIPETPTVPAEQGCEVNPTPTPSEEPSPEPSEEPSPEPTPTPEPQAKTVKISKADMNGVEVEGAHIVVKAGEDIVDEWDSTLECHVIELLPGTYTLEETVAPEGFKKVETVVEFSVDEEGNVTVLTTEVVNGKVEVKEDGTLVLSDEPEDEPEATPEPQAKTVKISKADMDGVEVEGAHIVVKAGEDIVDEWDSTLECHVIELLPGTYTLEETVAPEGFKKVETVVEFSVDEEGNVTVLTTEVVNGKVEVKKDGTLVLSDEPEDEPEATPEPTRERPTSPSTPDEDIPSNPGTPKVDKPSTPTPTVPTTTTTTRRVVDTADNSMMARYAGMLVASLGVAIVTILKRREYNN